MTSEARTKKQQFESKQERCEILGKYIVENNATVRSAAKIYGVSKSTVHQDITAVLSKTNPVLYAQVRLVLEKNKAERHLRGGEATKRKYSGSGKAVKNVRNSY